MIREALMANYNATVRTTGFDPREKAKRPHPADDEPADAPPSAPEGQVEAEGGEKIPTTTASTRRKP